MSPSFLDVSAPEIAARIEAIASSAAGAPVLVRVAAEAYGSRNIGIDLPPGRRSALEGRAMRGRMREALERAGVVMAVTAIAPKAAGDLRGTVRVREVTPNRRDASHMLRPPRRG
jgi:hypothetical protein